MNEFQDKSKKFERTDFFHLWGSLLPLLEWKNQIDVVGKIACLVIISNFVLNHNLEKWTLFELWWKIAYFSLFIPFLTLLEG